jgi:hypothetical protein
MALAPRRFEIWTTPGRPGAAAARVLYQPRRRARTGAVAFAHALPRRRGRLPESDVATIVERVAGLVAVPAAAAAALHARESGRWLIALTGSDGSGVVVKVGRPDDEGLARERSMLDELATRVTRLQIPRLRWHGLVEDRLVIVTDISTRRRAHPEPDLDEARAVACALATVSGGFVVHGDLAPWNIVPTADGLALVDWEDGCFEEDPLHDLAHYVTRAGALLRAWRPDTAVHHLTGRGSAGPRYLAEIGRGPEEAPEHLVRYLRRPGSESSSPALRRYEIAMAEALAARPAESD